MRSVIVALVLFVAQQANAAATIFLRSTTSLFQLPVVASTTNRGGACQLGTTNGFRVMTTATSAGSGTQLSKGHIPINGASPNCDFQDDSSSNVYMWWITPPLSAGFTISGNISANFAGCEAVTQANAAGSISLYRIDGNRGGIIPSGSTSGALGNGAFWVGNSTELNASTCTCAQRAISASAPTSTTFVTGDRILIIPQMIDGSGWAANGSRDVHVCYDDVSSAGQFSITFTETLTFSSDSAGPTTREQIMVSSIEEMWKTGHYPMFWKPHYEAL